MKKVAYVILHYLDIETTVNCIDSILKFNNPNQYVVVVDNGSPNDSSKILTATYNEYNEVRILEISKNLGFARGNNIGYKYAREELHADIIVVANNDTVFYEEIYNELIAINKTGNQIVLPDIINKCGKHQNPFREKPISNTKVYGGIFKKAVLAISYSMPYINTLMLKRFKKRAVSVSELDQLNIHDRQLMLVPHGACVIFCESWIQAEDLSFRNCTFMYGEEEILFEYVLIKGYKTIYDDKIKVLHLEDQATKRSITSEIKRAGFLHRNSFRSHLKLIKYRTIRLFRSKN